MSCPVGGQVISVISALYGRKNATICADYTDPMNTDCEAPNALHVVREECDGRSSCSIYTSNVRQFGADPCPGTPKYIQVDYTCYSHDSQGND